MTDQIFILGDTDPGTRFMQQFKKGIEKKLRKRIEEEGLNIQLYIVDGAVDPGENSPGSFTNWGATGSYKLSQIQVMCDNLAAGYVRPGAKVLLLDAANTSVLLLKFTAKMLGIPIKIFAWWHSGAHDPNDWLGRVLAGEQWAFTVERAVYQACDVNYFGTRYYANMFSDRILGEDEDFSKIRVCGQPHEQTLEDLAPFKGTKKRNQICVPARNSVEKQLPQLRDLAEHMPDFEFVFCQDKVLKKAEYHQVIAESIICPSVALQENLGIATNIEAPYLDCLPLAPDRASYSEIYRGYEDFLYPSLWSENWDSYVAHRDLLANTIRYMASNYDSLLPVVRHYVQHRMPLYANADPMFDDLLA